MRGLLVWIFLSLPLGAKADVAGEFDYFVLALSWSPNWCAVEGDSRGSDQCHPLHDHGWILHGLWPQYTRGYPEYCQTTERPPSRRMTGDMADIMGTGGINQKSGFNKTIRPQQKTRLEAGFSVH